MNGIRRGSALILVLLLLTLFVIAGLGLLGQRVSQRRGSASALQTAQARALAYAGLEDVRVKLNKDPGFPPASAIDQPIFGYTEPVMELDGSARRGHYRIVLDSRWNQAPYYLVKVSSIGRLETSGGAIISSYSVKAEFDMAPESRDGSGAPNPGYFAILRVVEEGSSEL